MLTLQHLLPGLHLNGDEAVALGAAFAGANASRAFHVRQVRLVTQMTESVLIVKLEHRFRY